jgi:predicted Ser/Thr protein kinase
MESSPEDAESLFLELLDLEPFEQEQRLKTLTCDAATCDQVRALLAADQSPLAFPSPTLAHSLLGESLHELAGSANDWSAQDLIGKQVGNYRVLRHIASGGMGSVYEAEQSAPRRHVALKVLDVPLLTEHARRRFELEVDILSKLRHPAIAQIYEAGIATIAGFERPYFSMDFISNASSILEFATSHELDQSRRVELFTEVCDAVQCGHDLGVVHRDLKPDNILIGETQRPTLIDFGVARVLESGQGSGPGLTQDQRIVGTVQYMSPEQLAGHSHEVRFQSDVYSLGAVLFEMLCGVAPHDLKGLTFFQAAKRRIESPKLAPRTACPDLPKGLVAVLEMALATSPDKRYPSAGHLAKDLRAFLAHRPLLAQPPTFLSRVATAIQEHPRWATFTFCAIIGFSVLGSTFGAAAYYSNAPFALSIAPDEQSVVLRARSGTELHRWGKSGRVLLASILESEQLGRIAAIGFLSTDLRSESFTGFSIFPIDDPSHRIWGTSQFPLSPPSSVPLHEDGQFLPSICKLLDLFPDHPGPEVLICTKFHPYSQTAIRIFSLSGELLYEVWHDGAIKGVSLGASPGTLECVSWYSWLRWDERGKGLHPQSSQAVHFRLTPREGHIANENYIVVDDQLVDSTVEHYEWLGPPKVVGKLDHYEISLNWVHFAREGRSVPMLGVNDNIEGSQPPKRPGLEIPLYPIPGGPAPWTDDNYKARLALDEAIPPEDFRWFPLSELPSVTPPEPR